eukprot:scaffold14854_cov53-Phaeocystis_antarctica.AAC.1
MLAAAGASAPTPLALGARLSVGRRRSRLRGARSSAVRGWPPSHACARTARETAAAHRSSPSILSGESADSRRTPPWLGCCPGPLAVIAPANPLSD